MYIVYNKNAILRRRKSFHCACWNLHVWKHSHISQGTIYQCIKSLDHTRSTGNHRDRVDKMDAMHPRAKKSIQFIYEVLNINILWNMKIIFLKYLLHK